MKQAMLHPSTNGIYKVDLREFEFLIHEQFHEAKDIFKHSDYAQLESGVLHEMLLKAKNFATDHLSASYQTSDSEGCTLKDGQVILPSQYRELWALFKDEWGSMAGSDQLNTSALPPFVMQMILEMFMGANPSFMTYGGFCLPSSTLVDKYGTELQKHIFKEKLATSEWTSCLCLTEPQAGSDISLVDTQAQKQPDGTYILTGEKYLISAGMHDLTDNTLYFVIGRGETSSKGTFGLSCFIVPKFWVNDDGSLGEFNHVNCVGLAEKMGFNGCANAHLTFGDTGPCRAHLLGSRENVGLLQFLTLMNQARISTGVYALGMASSAYYNALSYASSRLQGKRFQESFNPKAERVNIIEHADVQRMLMEMKSKVEGCRALVAKLTLADTLASLMEKEIANDHEDNIASESKHAKRDSIAHYRGLVNLLTPVVKAYISDQAWRISELAIQTCGGQGYLKHMGLEQYARDIKVLAIWEGTNYIQSQDLIRDKLALGNTGKLFKIYRKEITQFLNTARDFPLLQAEFEQLNTSYQHLEHALESIQQWVKSKRMDKIPTVSTRILHLMGDVTIAWLLLQGACVSSSRLSSQERTENTTHTDVSDSVLAGIDINGAREFYQAKIAGAQYFIFNELPKSRSTLDIILNHLSECQLTVKQWQGVLAGVVE